METSGRPAAVFGPEIINQLGVVEIVLHSLGQLRLSHCNKEGSCSVLDCITRPESEQGGTIKSVELEKVNGILIWSIDVAQPGKKDLTDVWVDATTGKITAVEVETPVIEKKEVAEHKARKWLSRYNAH